MYYEVIVVGGGHAGCEAALATSRMKHKTLLVTGNLKNIADMPCNPSIGGSAKGIVVREIDALGGQMGINTDRTHLQIKMLNFKKGPAVQALRAQGDKITYPKEMLKNLKEEKYLEIKEGIVENLIVEQNKVKGVILEDGTQITSNSVILTTGTYLASDILVGDTRRREGPHGEKPSNFLSENLKKLGFVIKRLKTGTPQRLEKASIDFSKTRIEEGDKEYHTFSFDTEPLYDINSQVPCHIVYTNEKTHQIIRDNLNKSSMYGGLDDIKGIGPRYCPSIEDKVVRFSDKKRHQLFLEPESLYYDDIYLQGFSTSMPHDIQEQMVHSIEGLEHAKILKYAYAIEYDSIYPTQLKRSLETKLIENLFTAGQINGTSGYEEAAGQGIIAGINAARKLENKEPLILKRNEAYIGVLIDDLVTKGIRDPYRLLTSRAEYRLLLRSDNADLRLTEYGYEVGLIKEDRYKRFQEKKQHIEEIKEKFKTIKISPTKEINDYFKQNNLPEIKDGFYLYEFVKRPEITLEHLLNIVKLDYKKVEIEEALIQIKYEGYIIKEEKEAQKMLSLENKKIPENINYDKVKNIASEARQKLKEVMPTSIGQALRISGVNPADISVLSVYIKKEYNHEFK